MEAKRGERRELDRERWELLREVEDWLETPMVVLGFVWLGLLVVELVRGLGPALEWATTLIWIVFILDFLLRLVLAPDRTDYLKANWLTVVALVIPAFRVLRVARVFRVLRGVRLVKVVASLNRGMRALRGAMGRRGLGYVVALTVLVALAGAAGMYALEREAEGGGIRSFGDAVWWTAMILTTMGSEYWPQTPEGRVLAFILAVYAFTIFGYVTAALASYFVGRDAENAEAEVAGEASLRTLHEEIAALREEVRALRGGGE
ncbi:MAG TPA: ion transporter [Longimicrobiaceae bacterium]|nr:ion transporter [Longimicrobiaceae bacterium]